VLRFTKRATFRGRGAGQPG